MKLYGFALSLVILVPCLASCARSTRSPMEGPEKIRRVSVTANEFVTEDGERIELRGVNAGNWFLLEMWMLSHAGDGLVDDYTFNKNLSDRFGEERAWELMDVYRENWIQPRDFEIIKSFGFNVVRLPFNYELIARYEGDELVLRKDPFFWLDRAVELAEAHGLYIIIDMHGVPGRQSVDQPAGRVGLNQLWSNRKNQERTVWLWGEIAKHYEGRGSIAGYDLINEPYGNFSMDVRPVLGPLMYEIADKIRSIDKDVVLFFSNPIWGGHAFYGSPRERGYRNIAFTEHHYPGLFGSERSLRSHWGLFGDIPAKAKKISAQGGPLFIGEFNPVFEDLGGGDLMRAYFDRYAAAGWASTIWSYKILHKEGSAITDNWYMATNKAPLMRIDFRTAPEEEIRAWFESLGSMELIVDEPMRLALTRPDPVAIPIHTLERGTSEPPAKDVFVGWSATDIGDAKAGGQKVYHQSAVEIYGAGSDIWANSDSFRFVGAPAGATQLSARLHHLVDTAQYAKAGVMLRGGLDADAPFAFLHIFNDGRIMFSQRNESGGTVVERPVGNFTFPVDLRLTKEGGKAVAWISMDQGNGWSRIAEVSISDIDNAQFGLAVSSHAPDRFTTAGFSHISTDGNPPADPSNPFPPPANPEKVQIANPSFEGADGWTYGSVKGAPTPGGKQGGRSFHAQLAEGETAFAYQVLPVLRPNSEVTLNAAVRAAGATRDSEWGAAVLRLQLQLPDGRWLTFAEQRSALSGASKNWTSITLRAAIPGGYPLRLAVGGVGVSPRLDGAVISIADVEVTVMEK
ncbi:MAG: cellulase family glycosylhydrolase [Candidatus Sumerlaeia bacterium]|nr:cellulase family glycosylhydrolase [Candidatus Sumerlaeia bacterium]